MGLQAEHWSVVAGKVAVYKPEAQVSEHVFSKIVHSPSLFDVALFIRVAKSSNELLGSDQWTLGPGAHFSTEIGRLSTGFFIWQSWGLTNNPSKKAVNQLFGKPYFIYAVSEKWNLIYVPLGLSHSWKSPQGDDWTVPIGGGVRRLCSKWATIRWACNSRRSVR